MSVSRGQVVLTTLVIGASLIGSGFLAFNTKQQNTDAQNAKARIAKIAKQKKTAKSEPTKIKKNLPSKFKEAKDAAKKVMAAQKVYAKAVYGTKGGVNDNSDYRDAKAVMSTLVDNSASWKPAETPWVKNPEWQGVTEFEGPSGNQMYPVAFVFRDKKGTLMSIVQTEYDITNEQFTNINTFVTKKGADNASAYADKFWQDRKVNDEK